MSDAMPSLPTVTFAEQLQGNGAHTPGPEEIAAAAERRRQAEYQAKMDMIRKSKLDMPGRPILTDRRQSEAFNHTILSGGLQTPPDFQPIVGAS